MSAYTEPQPARVVRAEFIIRIGVETYEIGQVDLEEATWERQLPEALRGLADDIDYVWGASQ